MLLEDPSKRSDPRDNLQKARRFELWRYASRHKIAEITEDMPARLMRKRLRARGIQNLDTPLAEPVLGGKRGQSASPQIPPVVPQVNADDELERQWLEARRAETEVPETHLKGPKLRHFLRRQCKDRGIATKRTDTIPDLRARLNGQNAA